MFFGWNVDIDKNKNRRTRLKSAENRGLFVYMKRRKVEKVEISGELSTTFNIVGAVQIDTFVHTKERWGKSDDNRK